MLLLEAGLWIARSSSSCGAAALAGDCSSSLGTRWS